MKFPIFASFIVLCLFTTFTIKKRTADHEKKEDEFWERERTANSTRRQSLDDLPYIHLPFDKFICPELSETGKEEFQRSYDILENLDLGGIVNLSGQTNTDLKLKYGVANLDTLTFYDQNYTDTLIGLDHIAHLLVEEGFDQEALVYLEYAVSIDTDISTTYELLTSLYQKLGTPRKIDNLVPIAEKLKSMQKDKILSMLQTTQVV